MLIFASNFYFFESLLCKPAFKIYLKIKLLSVIIENKSNNLFLQAILDKGEAKFFIKWFTHDFIPQIFTNMCQALSSS